jgi:hypothetical protein
MSRSLSPTVKALLLGTSAEDVLLELIEISHTLFSTVYLVSNNEDVTSNGHTYSKFPFTVQLPDQSQGLLPQGTFAADNVDQSLRYVFNLALAAERPILTYKRALASDPDTVVIGPYSFKIGKITSDDTILRATITLDVFADDPFPAHLMDPQKNPGLHQEVA